MSPDPVAFPEIQTPGGPEDPGGLESFRGDQGNGNGYRHKIIYCSCFFRIHFRAGQFTEGRSIFSKERSPVIATGIRGKQSVPPGRPGDLCISIIIPMMPSGIVIHIEQFRSPQCFHIGTALCEQSLIPRPVQRRKQHSGENRNNRNHHRRWGR